MILRDARRVEHNLGPRPAGQGHLACPGLVAIITGSWSSKGRNPEQERSAYGLGRDSLATNGNHNHLMTREVRW